MMLFTIRNFFIPNYILCEYICNDIFHFYVFLRIYNIGYTLDIKLLFDNCHRLYLINCSHFSFLNHCYLILNICLLLFCLVSIFLKLHKLFVAHLFKLHIFYFNTLRNDASKVIGYYLMSKLADIGQSFLIIL